MKALLQIIAGEHVLAPVFWEMIAGLDVLRFVSIFLRWFWQVRLKKSFGWR